MNIIKTICTATAVLLAGMLTSCSDYLDVSKELAKNLDKEEVFSKAKYIKQWYAELYQTCPNYSETGLDVQGSNGTVNAQAIYSGEIVCAHPNVLKFGQNTFTPSSTTHNRWWNCYKQIRQAMIFLDMAPESIGDPINADGYISVEELKREIEILSRFKINVFHWHLTENQAWRLESKIFPMLNDSINTVRMPGKYYTLEEARELVDFCKQHQVMLIPEIDMPGHSAAFIRTFRHDMQSPEGMKILKLLIDEVCETFDVPYLHIGTDEVAFTNPDFVPEMVSYVRSKGKKVISWNPGWHYKPGEIDMTHLWSYRGKAQPGIPAIDSKFHYLNHFDTFADLVALYNSRIYNKVEGSDDIAGTILAIWNDRMISKEEDMIVQNGFYPSMLAIAERAWRGGGTEYFDGNGTMLPAEDTETFHEFVDFENRMLWHKEHTFKGYPFAYVKQTDVKWNITDAFPNGGDLSKVFPPEQELKESYEYEGKTYGTRKAIGAGIYLRHVWGTMVPAFYKDPKENHTSYAYTWVYSPKDQEVGLWAEFQNYSRSEMDLAPLQGKWDYKGSRIWINDKEIMPPVWTATHRVKSNEVPLGNENCVVRPPLLVHLNKGWNKVLLKLPIGKFGMDETRLVKWMFTTVFVTPDGEKAVEGLIYSPEKQL